MDYFEKLFRILKFRIFVRHFFVIMGIFWHFYEWANFKAVDCSGTIWLLRSFECKRIKILPGNRSLTRKITQTCVVFKTPKGKKDEASWRFYETFINLSHETNSRQKSNKLRNFHLQAEIVIFEWDPKKW